MQEGLISYSYPHGIDATLAGHALRTASQEYSQAGMLTSVIYPAGGYTNFEYELHESYYTPSTSNLVGGGLRIKGIANFSANNEVEGVIAYVYLLENNNTGGVYLV